MAVGALSNNLETYFDGQGKRDRLDMGRMGGAVAELRTLVASCYRNRDKLWPDEPLGSYADFTTEWDAQCLLFSSGVSLRAGYWVICT